MAPFLRSVLVSFAVLVIALNSARADWSVDPLSLPAPVTVVRQAGDRVYVRAGLWFHVTTCGDREICLKPGAPPAVVRASNGIPDGTVATDPGPGIVRAWYSEPTGRYGHAILGDRIEAGALEAVDAAGQLYGMSLDPNFVFEDLTPRLADMDGDGTAEIVSIRSQQDAGAAIAVYGIRKGRLVEIAATASIGRPNRWLNVAGIADFTGDGRLDIALVTTPHIGGRLEIWTLVSGLFTRVAAAEGFSNHAIGSTELGLSAVADVDGDGVPDLALPDAERSALRIVSVRDGANHSIAAIPLEGSVVTAIGTLGPPHRPIFVVGLEGGRAVVVRKH